MVWREEYSSSKGQQLLAKEVALTKLLVGSTVLVIVCMVPSLMIRLAELVVLDYSPKGRFSNLHHLRLCLSTIFI